MIDAEALSVARVVYDHFGGRENFPAAWDDMMAAVDKSDAAQFVRQETIYAGTRFMIYALYPEANISIHVLWGLKQHNTVFATGKSILNRSSKSNAGELMLKYGGGGHDNAGTCQVANGDAPRVLVELIAKINSDG